MYTVTRQIQWPTGEHMVEVSEGGIDYTNPDALVANYPGEFQEFEDPREAVETAIDICRAWRKDGEKNAKVGVGATGGHTMPFDGCTFKEAINWAEEVWEKLEKCPTCGRVTEDLQEWWQAGEWIGDEFYEYDDGNKYCSEYCAEKASVWLAECSVCGELCNVKTAHLNQEDEYIGDECCWDTWLKSSE